LFQKIFYYSIFVVSWTGEKTLYPQIFYTTKSHKKIYCIFRVFWDRKCSWTHLLRVYQLSRVHQPNILGLKNWTKFYDVSAEYYLKCYFNRNNKKWKMFFFFQFRNLKISKNITFRVLRVPSKRFARSSKKNAKFIWFSNLLIFISDVKMWSKFERFFIWRTKYFFIMKFYINFI